MFVNRRELRFKKRAALVMGKIDPRCRLVSGLLLITTAVFLESPLLLGAAAGLLFILLLLFTENPAALFARLAALSLFVLMLWITLPLGGGGYKAAFHTALRYSLRIYAAALAYMLAVLPLGPGGLANTLLALKVSGKLVTLLMLTYRAIFLLYDRVAVSVTSLEKRRPAKPRVLPEWKAYAALFASALVKADIRSQKMHLAMRSRGFLGLYPRTAELRWRAGDTVLLSAAAFCAALLVYIDRTAFI